MFAVYVRRRRMSQQTPVTLTKEDTVLTRLSKYTEIDFNISLMRLSEVQLKWPAFIMYNYHVYWLFFDQSLMRTVMHYRKRRFYKLTINKSTTERSAVLCSEAGSNRWCKTSINLKFASLSYGTTAAKLSEVVYFGNLTSTSRIQSVFGNFLAIFAI